MSSIMGQIESENWELFALEFGKIAESDFVYTPASTNIDQSAPYLVTMYVTLRLWMSSIMDLIGPELSELSALEFENFPYLTVYTLASTNIDQSASNLVKMYMTIRSRMSLIMDQIGSELSELSTLELENLPYLTLFTL